MPRLLPGQHDRLQHVPADDSHRGQIEEEAQQPQTHRLAERKLHAKGPHQVPPPDERDQDRHDVEARGRGHERPVLGPLGQIGEDFVGLRLNHEVDKNAHRDPDLERCNDQLLQGRSSVLTQLVSNSACATA